MEKWNWIRQRVLRDGVSIREIQHFNTVKRILAHASVSFPVKDTVLK